MIRHVVYTFNGAPVMVYNRKVYPGMPIISTHLHTPAVSANSSGYELGLRILAGLIHE